MVLIRIRESVQTWSIVGQRAPSAREMRNDVPVYFLRAGDSPYVKIGYALDPLRRAAELQTAHYEELRIVRIIEGGRASERLAHKLMAHLHVRGEWHLWHEDMLHFDAAAVQPGAGALVIGASILDWRPALTELLAGRTSMAAIGRANGISRERVRQVVKALKHSGEEICKLVLSKGLPGPYHHANRRADNDALVGLALEQQTEVARSLIGLGFTIQQIAEHCRRSYGWAQRFSAAAGRPKDRRQPSAETLEKRRSAYAENISRVSELMSQGMSEAEIASACGWSVAWAYVWTRRAGRHALSHVNRRPSFFKGHRSLAA